MKTFSFSDNLKTSWGLYKKEWQVLLPAALIFLAVSYVFDRLDGPAGSENFFITIVGMLVSVFLSAGAVALGFKVLRGQKASLEDLVSQRENFLHLLVASIILGLAFIVGLILLIIPGIYIIVRFYYATVVLVDEPKLTAIEAIKKSGDLTKGNFWQTLVVIVLSGLLNLVGVLALGVGLLISIPVSGLITLSYYEYLKGLKADSASASAAVTETTATAATPAPAEESKPAETSSEQSEPKA
jgi:uncharacterized membrane protein